MQLSKPNNTSQHLVINPLIKGNTCLYTAVTNRMNERKHLSTNVPKLEFNIFSGSNSLITEKSSDRVLRILSMHFSVTEKDVIAIESVDIEKKTLLYINDELYKKLFRGKNRTQEKVSNFIKRVNKGIYSYSLDNDFALSEFKMLVGRFDYVYNVNEKELKVNKDFALAVGVLSENHHLENSVIYKNEDIKTLYQSEFDSTADADNIKISVFLRFDFREPMSLRSNRKIDRFGGYEHLKKNKTHNGNNFEYVSEHKFVVFTATHKEKITMMIIDIQKFHSEHYRKDGLKPNYNEAIKYQTEDRISMTKVLNFYAVSAKDRLIGNGVYIVLKS